MVATVNNALKRAIFKPLFTAGYVKTNLKTAKKKGYFFGDNPQENGKIQKEKPILKNQIHFLQKDKKTGK